jgi:hypothetical protein
MPAALGTGEDLKTFKSHLLTGVQNIYYSINDKKELLRNFHDAGLARIL